MVARGRRANYDLPYEEAVEAENESERDEGKKGWREREREKKENETSGDDVRGGRDRKEGGEERKSERKRQ